MRNIIVCGHWLATKAIRADGYSHSCDRLRGNCIGSPRCALARMCASTCMILGYLENGVHPLRECEAARTSPVLDSGLSGISKGVCDGNVCANAAAFCSRRDEENEQERRYHRSCRSWHDVPDRNAENARKRRNLRRSIWTFRFIYLPPSVIISG